MLWLPKYQVSDPKTIDHLGGFAAQAMDGGIPNIGARQGGPEERLVATLCARPACFASIFVHKIQQAFLFILDVICGFHDSRNCLAVDALCCVYGVWGNLHPRQRDPRPWDGTAGGIVEISETTVHRLSNLPPGHLIGSVVR